MSRGAEDIFDIIVLGMDDEFRQHHVHLSLIEVKDTQSDVLVQHLTDILTKYNLTQKNIACVKDGGSTLQTCSEHDTISWMIQDIVSCSELGMDSCFKGLCFAHILSNAFNAATSRGVYQDLESIDFNKVLSGLQKCITWTKKSGKGREEWYRACREENIQERLVPTPVKTKLASTVAMTVMMLKFRQVVDRCYSRQPSLNLGKRVLSSQT